MTQRYENKKPIWAQMYCAKIPLCDVIRVIHVPTRVKPKQETTMANKTNKLTLSVSSDIVELAKTYAEAKRTTLTAMVQDYLSRIINGKADTVHVHMQGALVEFAGVMISAKVKEHIRSKSFLYLDSGELILLDTIFHRDAVLIRDFIKNQSLPIVFETICSQEEIDQIYNLLTPKKEMNIQKMQADLGSILKEAIKINATDIHMVEDKEGFTIRYRVISTIKENKDLSVDLKSLYMEEWIEYLDTLVEKLNGPVFKMGGYYSGRILGNMLSFDQNLVEKISSIRVQINPAPNGAYLIMRIIYRSMLIEGGFARLSELGVNRKSITDLKKIMKKPFGCLLISGPTGSGKTTTLSILTQYEAHKSTSGVVTFESPIDYTIHGAKQLPVLSALTDQERNEKFRQAISASLRSEPDMVMIGEIRDEASCNLAFVSAMTGHHVLASMHANDAISIIDRLRDLRVEEYKFADPTLVGGLMSQRLIDLLCPACKIPFKKALECKLVTLELAQALESKGLNTDDIFVGNQEGCEACAHGRLGYTNRTAITETIVPDKKFMELMKIDKYHAYIHACKELGFISMQDDAIFKMCQGSLDPMDVEDKTGDLSTWDETKKDYIFKTLAE